MPKILSLHVYMFMIMSSLLFSPNYSHADQTSAQENGFTLEVQLGTGNNILIDDNMPALSTSYSGLMFGKKFGGLILGLGLSFDQNAQSRSQNDFDSERSITTILLVPSLRVTFLSSADQKVELIGLLDVGLGSTDTLSEDSDYEEDLDDPETVILDAFYQLGTGVRYWIHPQLALGAHGGVRSEFKRLTYERDSSFEATQHRTGIFTGFSVTGIF